MISTTTSPKNKSQLVTTIQKMSPNTKFDVIEVFSSTDKQSVMKMFDNYLRQNGHFSVMFINGGK